MSALLDFIGAFMFLTGAAFLLFGGLGLFRMPDLYNRLQAGTKTTTLGSLLILLGTAFLYPQWWLKLLLIGLFLLFTNPLSSQVLASAAHRNGVKPCDQTKVDLLAQDLEDKS